MTDKVLNGAIIGITGGDTDAILHGVAVGVNTSSVSNIAVNIGGLQGEQGEEGEQGEDGGSGSGEDNNIPDWDSETNYDGRDAVFYRARGTGQTYFDPLNLIGQIWVQASNFVAINTPPDIGKDWNHFGAPIAYREESEHFTGPVIAPTIPAINKIIGTPPDDDNPTTPRVGGRSARIGTKVVNSDTGVVYTVVFDSDDSEFTGWVATEGITNDPEDGLLLSADRRIRINQTKVPIIWNSNVDYLESDYTLYAFGTSELQTWQAERNNTNVEPGSSEDDWTLVSGQSVDDIAHGIQQALDSFITFSDSDVSWQTEANTDFDDDDFTSLTPIDFGTRHAGFTIIIDATATGVSFPRNEGITLLLLTDADKYFLVRYSSVREVGPFTGTNNDEPSFYRLDCYYLPESTGYLNSASALLNFNVESEIEAIDYTSTPTQFNNLRYITIHNDHSGEPLVHSSGNTFHLAKIDERAFSTDFFATIQNSQATDLDSDNFSDATNTKLNAIGGGGGTSDVQDSDIRAIIESDGSLATDSKSGTINSDFFDKITLYPDIPDSFHDEIIALHGDTATAVFTAANPTWVDELITTSSNDFMVQNKLYLVVTTGAVTAPAAGTEYHITDAGSLTNAADAKVILRFNFAASFSGVTQYRFDILKGKTEISESTDAVVSFGGTLPAILDTASYYYTFSSVVNHAGFLYRDDDDNLSIREVNTDDFVKNASISGTTLTLTQDDDTTIDITIPTSTPAYPETNGFAIQIDSAETTHASNFTGSWPIADAEEIFGEDNADLAYEGNSTVSNVLGGGVTNNTGTTQTIGRISLDFDITSLPSGGETIPSLIVFKNDSINTRYTTITPTINTLGKVSYTSTDIVEANEEYADGDKMGFVFFEADNAHRPFGYILERIRVSYGEDEFEIPTTISYIGSTLPTDFTDYPAGTLFQRTGSTGVGRYESTGSAWVFDSINQYPANLTSGKYVYQYTISGSDGSVAEKALVADTTTHTVTDGTLSSFTSRLNDHIVVTRNGTHSFIFLQKSNTTNTESESEWVSHLDGSTSYRRIAPTFSSLADMIFGGADESEYDNSHGDAVTEFTYRSEKYYDVILSADRTIDSVAYTSGTSIFGTTDLESSTNAGILDVDE